MRFLRVLLAIVLVIVILAGVAVVVAFHNQPTLVAVVLARINAGTGLEIRPARTRLRFGGHLDVLLERPTVYFHGREVARLEDLRAIVNYHAIFAGNGLPLHSLELDRPIVQMPANAAGVTPHGLPKPDVEAADNLLAALDAIGDVTYRVEVHGAQLHDVNSTPLIDYFTVVARKEHRRSGRLPWLLEFDAHWAHAPFAGLGVSGNVRLGAEPGQDVGSIMDGRVVFRGLALSGFEGPAGLKATGSAAGFIRFSMARNGVVTGAEDADFTKLAVSGPSLAAPIIFGDCALRSRFSASATRMQLSEIEVSKGQSVVIAGALEIGAPYDPDRTISLSVGDGKFAIANVAAQVRHLRAIPSWLSAALARLTSGQVRLIEASLDSTVPLRKWNALTIRDDLSLKASVAGAGYDSPASSGLPAVRRVSATVIYNRGKLTVSDASGYFGDSNLKKIDGEAQLRDAPREIFYRLRVSAKLNAGEIFALAAPLLASRGPAWANRLQGARGAANISGRIAGRVTNSRLLAPGEYSFDVSPERLGLKIRGAPTQVDLNDGVIAVRPDELQIKNLIVSPALSGGGNLMLGGAVRLGAPYPRFENLVVEAHRIRAERWMPLFVDQNQMNVRGPISGRLNINSDSSNNRAPTVTGNLTMGSGELGFGFLRSPIMVNAATVALNGTGLELDIPNATLEGKPIDLNMKVADLANPKVEIDANAEDFDFEALKFIRMPWSPKAKVTVFPLPVFGHLKAQHAKFGNLMMTNMATDFERGGGHWRVYNFVSRALGGRARLSVSGLTGPDNWIHIVGRGVQMDAAQIFLLSGNRKPAIVGKLGTTLDIWADTDVDFFSSMYGKIGIEATNGTLNRFALISRILSFIDVKNWLTARLPDPDASGIPFTKLSCDANGMNGIFETKNFKLRGPVMEITATGSVDAGNDVMNMHVALMPFDSFNWLVAHIPFIGRNLATGSKGLVAAYFHVYGPINDPTVVPQPITSVAEFIAKTLSLPINLIAPNTIKP